MSDINYRYNEPELLQQIQAYIDSTYTQHYSSKGGVQVTEFIVGQRQSSEFLIGCAIKYASRYGFKNGYNRADLLKAVHTLIQALYYHEALDMESRGQNAAK